MVASFGIAATAVLLTLQPALAFIVPNTNNIFARQLSGFTPSSVPSSCAKNCQALETTFTGSNACLTLQCMCTATIANGLKSCLQCAAGAGATGYTAADANNALTQFEQGCASGGFAISGVSASGGTSGSNGGLGGSAGVSGLGSSPSASGLGLGASASATGLGLGTSNTAAANTASAVANTAAATAATPASTGGLPRIGAASKISTGSFGIMITAALGAIALL